MLITKKKNILYTVFLYFIIITLFISFVIDVILKFIPKSRYVYYSNIWRTKIFRIISLTLGRVYAKEDSGSAGILKTRGVPPTDVHKAEIRHATFRHIIIIVINKRRKEKKIPKNKNRTKDDAIQTYKQIIVIIIYYRTLVCVFGRENAGRWGIRSFSRNTSITSTIWRLSCTAVLGTRWPTAPNSNRIVWSRFPVQAKHKKKKKFIS